MCISKMLLCWFVAGRKESSVGMDLLSALVDAGSLPTELLQQMLTADAVSTVKEQQVIHAYCVQNVQALTAWGIVYALVFCLVLAGLLKKMWVNFFERPAFGQ